MSKKQDAFYYDTFIACAKCAGRAARFLKDILTDFEPDRLYEQMQELHAIEHEADGLKHEMMDRLAREFIPPIEQEDIMSLSHYIDEMTDKIYDVSVRVYINNVRVIRPEALDTVELIIRCCEEVTGLMEEFPGFRKSKKLREIIIRINSMEEEADRLYIEHMRTLHTDESVGVREIIAWREIYLYLERCADACEHVADTVSSVVMKNS